MYVHIYNMLVKQLIRYFAVNKLQNSKDDYDFV